MTSHSDDFVLDVRSDDFKHLRVALLVLMENRTVTLRQVDNYEGVVPPVLIGEWASQKYGSVPGLTYGQAHDYILNWLSQLKDYGARDPDMDSEFKGFHIERQGWWQHPKLFVVRPYWLGYIK
jgi:hypothetical protein